MPNLIPTARVDKHGRAVIRHMKPGVSSTTTALTQVPPVLPRAVEDLTPALKAAAEVCAKQTRWAAEDMELRLDGYSKAELEAVVNLSTAKSKSPLWCFINNMRDIPRARDILHLGHYLAECGADDPTIDILIDCLQKYEELTPQGNDGTYPRERLEQCRAVIGLTLQMSVSYIEDEKLRRFIFDPTTRAETVNIVTERRIRSGNEVEAILAENAGALTNGVL